MPEDLRAHIRYPEDLFAIQAQMYATYHMRDPQVFYNKEDLLSIPRQTVSGTEREMAPYYTIMRLPGETKEEFVLLLPFTPNAETICGHGWRRAAIHRIMGSSRH